MGRRNTIAVTGSYKYDIIDVMAYTLWIHFATCNF